MLLTIFLVDMSIDKCTTMSECCCNGEEKATNIGTPVDLSLHCLIVSAMPYLHTCICFEKRQTTNRRR